MASTSASYVQKSFKYDVFLSFRGEDTRNKFVSHLYKALEQSGIQTYKDDEKIEKGETIDTQLIKSIEDSRFYIIVFSKDYAGSSWCLDELAKIMECRKASEQTAYPIFYDVEPTEIRRQSGAVGEAFKKLKNKEAAEKWRKALNKAGKLAGWESKKTANGDESKLIQIIVDTIFQKISSSYSSFDEKFVGLKTRIEDVLSSLKLDVNDVRMIGIWGMGGGGKTTLARAVFDGISLGFDGTAFVENVREVSKSSLGLNKLQQQVLSSVGTNIIVSSVHEGSRMMKNMMYRKKVLVVLDDVDDTEQLEALTGRLDWFKLGSRVIITTRDKQVLLSHGVKFINNVNLLSHAEAISLFCKHAFIRDIPNEGYEELSKQVVQYADGLPLTIKVLGSLLCGQNVPQWIDTLERLKKIPLKATMEKLELSYNGLEEEVKDIFLDVACLLKGRKKDHAVMALQSCGFFAESGLRVLEQKSLITIYDDIGLRLGMHDHIEEMGKNIVRRLHPNEPERHSRLWIQKEIEEISAINMGTRATKCMILDADRLNVEILMKGLANMKKLRFLQVYYGEDASNFDEVGFYLPNALRFLSWDGYPFSSLPKTFQAKNLVGLRMSYSKMVQLWQDGEEKPFLKLKFLKFDSSNYLRTLDLSVAPNLETLILISCVVVVVHFQVTPKLRYLDLMCLNLRTLHLRITPNLETLRLRECTDMDELRLPAECPMLVNIDLEYLKLRTLDLGITPNLETLRVKNCSDMVELHMPAQCPKLVELDLSDIELKTLHLGITPNLKTLSLTDCRNLIKLHIPAECPKLVNLNLRNCLKLRTLHLGISPNLKTVNLKDCRYLVKLHIPADCPKLVNLDLSNCTRFAELPEEIGRLKCLKELDITGTCISRLPESTFRVKGLRIVGSRRLLESCCFTSPIIRIQTAYYEAERWCTVVE